MIFFLAGSENDSSVLKELIFDILRTPAALRPEPQHRKSSSAVAGTCAACFSN